MILVSIVIRFAFVGTKTESSKIHVLGAKRWLGRAFLEVERQIHLIDAKNPFDYYIVEQNSVGDHVVEVLRTSYSLPVIAVTTVGPIKDPKKVHSPTRMDKNDMVKYMITMFKDGRIIFPTNPQGEVLELLRQLSIFAEIRTESGNFSYRAEGSEHDDLVMALMLACFYCRFFVDRGENTHKYHTSSRKFVEREKDIYGSGIPFDATLKGRFVQMP